MARSTLHIARVYRHSMRGRLYGVYIHIADANIFPDEQYVYCRLCPTTRRGHTELVLSKLSPALVTLASLVRVTRYGKKGIRAYLPLSKFEPPVHCGSYAAIVDASKELVSVWIGPKWRLR